MQQLDSRIKDDERLPHICFNLQLTKRIGTELATNNAFDKNSHQHIKIKTLS
jgi:hypothetical protein